MPMACSAWILLVSPLVTEVSIDFWRQMADTAAPPSSTQMSAPAFGAKRHINNACNNEKIRDVVMVMEIRADTR